MRPKAPWRDITESDVLIGDGPGTTVQEWLGEWFTSVPEESPVVSLLCWEGVVEDPPNNWVFVKFYTPTRKHPLTYDWN